MWQFEQGLKNLHCAEDLLRCVTTMARIEPKTEALHVLHVISCPSPSQKVLLVLNTAKEIP